MTNRTKTDVDKRARMYGLKYASIYLYIKGYEENGVDGLIAHHEKKGSKSSKITKEVEKIIYRHIQEECGCCSSNSFKIHKIRNIREECKQKGLRSPAIQTIKNRIALVN